MDNNLSTYARLVRIAYGYFIGLGLLWLCAAYYFGGGFSFFGAILIGVFGMLAYFKKRLANLIVGILSLAVSIFCGLEFLSLGGQRGFTGFVSIMLGICVVSLIMSGILVFSYTKLAFENE